MDELKNKNKCSLKKRIKNPEYECRSEKSHKQCENCPYNLERPKKAISKDLKLLAGSGGGAH